LGHGRGQKAPAACFGVLYAGFFSPARAGRVPGPATVILMGQRRHTAGRKAPVPTWSGYFFRATRSAPVPLIELLTGRGRLPVMLLTGMFWGRACPADCLCFAMGSRSGRQLPTEPQKRNGREVRPERWPVNAVLNLLY